LLGVGLAGGAIPAILSILPALGQRGTKLPLLLLGSALTATLLFLGALVSGMGAAVIRRQPLLGTLRSE
jgi:hypothetical protein